MSIVTRGIGTGSTPSLFASCGLGIVNPVVSKVGDAELHGQVNVKRHRSRKSDGASRSTTGEHRHH